MHKKCRIISTIGITLCIALLIVKCSGMDVATIADAFIQEEEIETFYGRYVTRHYNDGELYAEINAQEWKGKGKKYFNHSYSRAKKEYVDIGYTDEMLDGDFVVFDEQDTIVENQLIGYTSHINKYYIKDLTLESEVKDNSYLIGINKVLQTGYLKDYVMELISYYDKDYILETENDIRIDGKLTQHVIATSKKKGDLDKFEMWIDQDTWMVVKELITQGNFTKITEYTEFQLNPIISKKRFEVNIPQDAQIVRINEGLQEVNEKITLEQATEKLGISVYYLEQSDRLTLSEVHYIVDPARTYGRVEIIYILNDGSKIIVENIADVKSYTQDDSKMDTVWVKGHKARYTENEQSQRISFNDEACSCKIYTQNSSISKAEFIKLINENLKMMEHKLLD